MNEATFKKSLQLTPGWKKINEKFFFEYTVTPFISLCFLKQIMNLRNIRNFLFVAGFLLFFIEKFQGKGTSTKCFKPAWQILAVKEGGGGCRNLLNFQMSTSFETSIFLLINTFERL